VSAEYSRLGREDRMKVIIELDAGGLIQNVFVDGKPFDAVIRDYYIDGTDDDQRLTDDEGREYVEYSSFGGAI